MQEQGSKHRSTISILNKTFRKYFTVFDVFTETAANFIKSFQLPRITSIHIHIYLLHSLFLLFFGVFLLACLFVFCEFMLLLCLYYLSLLLHICTDLLYSYRLQVAILCNLIFFQKQICLYRIENYLFILSCCLFIYLSTHVQPCI